MSYKSLEFLNENLSRAWPLSSETGGAAGTLPPTLLADCAIYTDMDAEISSVYVSRLEVSDVGWMLSLKVVINNSETELERVISVAFSSEKFSEAKFNSSNGEVNLAGSFTIGFPDAVKGWAASTTFSETNGKLDNGVINDVSGLFVTGIEVGGRLLTGTLQLVAGDGIDINVTDTSDSDASADHLIVITNTRYTVPGDNMTITDDDDILTQLMQDYGTPVRTINGISPDADGNISIIIPETEDQNSLYIMPGSVTPGSIVLSISKDPLLDADTVTTLTEGIAQLNERAARIDSSISALDRSQNTLATQMTRLS